MLQLVNQNKAHNAHIVKPMIDNPVTNLNHLLNSQHLRIQLAKTIKITYAKDNGILIFVKGMFRLVENSTRWKTSLSKRIQLQLQFVLEISALVKPWLFFLNDDDVIINKTY